MTQNRYDSIRPIVWQDDSLRLLDQRALPGKEHYLSLSTVEQVADAIHNMVVRGAPAIGITAAYGIVLSARARYIEDASNWKLLIESDLQILAASRPTAVNLFWAIDHMRSFMADIDSDPGPILLAEAERIHEADIADNKHMGKIGAAFIEPGSGVLTHCNTGSLATGGFGTALGVIRQAWSEHSLEAVFADETRPWLQGARLTAWELVHDNIPVSLVVDGAVAQLMMSGKVQWLIVGSDRIAANGDVANKIGTCTAAIVAKYFGVKVMVVAPTSTIDRDSEDGGAIPIETRPADELLVCGEQRIAADGAQGWNPVFDVTPAALVDVLVTEKGAIEKPNSESISSLLGT